MIENATLCSLPWTQDANFISKGTIMLQLGTSNSLVDCQLPCSPLSEIEFFLQCQEVATVSFVLDILYCSYGYLQNLEITGRLSEIDYLAVRPYFTVVFKSTNNDPRGGRSGGNVYKSAPQPPE